MTNSQSSISCKWLKADGTQCRETNVVPDSQYCHRHFWQALWTKEKLEQTPLPTKTDWILIIWSAVLFILFILGYSRDPGWILPTWVHTFIQVVATPQYYIENHLSVVFYLLGWFTVGFSMFLYTAIVLLVSCSFPLRPKSRQTAIIVFYLSAAINLVIAILSSISYYNMTGYIEPAWLLTIFSIVVIVPFLIIFIAAQKLDTAIIHKYAIRTLSLVAIFLLFNNFVLFLVGQGRNELSIVRLNGGVGGLLIGVLLLSANGRLELIHFITGQSLTLADAMYPLKEVSFLSTEVINRTQALQKALKIYSNLTPAEQEELDVFILGKHKPSLFQIILGILTIVLSTFFLEAPLQQVFLWLTCSFLHLGAPLCL